MKKRISKFLSVILASVFIIFSMPASVYGDYLVDGMSYRFGSGGVILTDCQLTTAEKITIPESAQINGLNFKVIGVDDYAFGYCENLTTIYAPSTLKTSEMGNVAFLTSSSIVDFINKELGEDATTEDVVKYIAKQINYNNGNYTDDDIDKITQKLMSHLNKVDTSANPTLEGKVMTLIKNMDQMGLSDATLMKFDIWVTGVTYSDMTIKAEAGSDIMEYLEAREFLGLQADETSIYPVEDGNCELYYTAVDSDGDGTNDGICITGYTGNIQKLEIPKKIDNLPVIEIAENAFTEALMLNTLTIPETVVTIGNHAIGYFPDGTPVADFTIYGYAGTPVERYAMKNSITFIDVTSLPALSQTEVELKVDQMFGISVKNYSGEIKWVSSDTTVATVSEGYIKGISSGEATVYAFAGNTTLECKVTVKGTPVYSTITKTTTTSYTGEPVMTLTTKASTSSNTTTLEPAITLTSKTTASSTLQPPTTNTVTNTVTRLTTLEPPISTTQRTSPTTTLEPPIHTITSTTVSSVSTSYTTPVKSTSITSTTPKVSTSLTSITTPISSTTSYITSTTTSSSVTVSSTTTSSSVTVSSTTTSSSVTVSSFTTSSLITVLSTTTSSSVAVSSTTTSSSVTVSSPTISTPVSVTTASVTTTSTSPIITTITTQSTPVQTKIVLLGDANEDGKVNVRDAAYIAKMLALGMSYKLPIFADYTQDKALDVRDAAALARALALKDNQHWVQIIIKVNQT